MTAGGSLPYSLLSKSPLDPDIFSRILQGAMIVANRSSEA